MDQYLKNFKNCLQKEIPFCMAECPFHLDVHDFIEKMKRGGFRGAFKAYRDAAGFPVIASALCHEPCKGVCPRKESDSPIEMGLLEKACISMTADRSPTDYNLPMKKKRVAVIGAGISGLACALRLCMKKYEVEIFEKSDRIGGSLWELLSPEVFLPDIEEQLQHEKYKLHFNTLIGSAEDLSGLEFDAVYAATGEGGEDFGLLSAREESGENRYCKVYDGTAWFAGGGLIGDMPVYALANGLNMGTVIDNFLKTGNLLNPPNIQKTCIQLDPAKLKQKEPQVIPQTGGNYTEAEARQEASRCLECQCDFCRTYCDLTDFYNKWPLRIRDEIIATTLPGSADVKATPAKRLLSTCNQCGLCKEVCPEEIDLGGLILEGRKSMHSQKKAPWVFHDFWLRDMDFANSPLAALTETACAEAVVKAPESLGAGESKAALPDGRNDCAYAFFPGCQLGASDPELVIKSYEYLRNKRPDTGLMLRCCGAPAEWSGDEEKFNSGLSTIRSLWAELGKPTLILACPTCEKKFKTYLEEIPVISLYEIIALWGLPAKPTPNEAGQISESRPTEAVKGLLTETAKYQGGKNNKKTYSVFDACAARHEAGMKEAVRTLAEAAGYRLEPLTENEVHGHCCSFGGQSGIANPKFAEFVVQKRIQEGDAPYITYCINCRDVFCQAGKASVHILDLLMGSGEVPERLPTVSQRRENRLLLKQELLKKFWNQSLKSECAGTDQPESDQPESGRPESDQPEANHQEKLPVVGISEELAGKLNREKILEEDVIRAVGFCERTGRRVFHPDKETYSGYHQIGYTTYWVEYRSTVENGRETESADGEMRYELVNAYAHHMKIELEAVWNGRKIDPDL